MKCRKCGHDLRKVEEAPPIDIMGGCFKILMDEIYKYEGTFNQFTGDGGTQ